MHKKWVNLNLYLSSLGTRYPHQPFQGEGMVRDSTRGAPVYVRFGAQDEIIISYLEQAYDDTVSVGDDMLKSFRVTQH